MDVSGEVRRLQLGKSGIGGETIPYQPEDHWSASRSAEERVGWSNCKANGNGFPNWINKQKQESIRILDIL